MKITEKAICALLTVIFACGAFAGCAQGGGQTAGTGETTAETTTEEPAVTEKTAPVLPAGVRYDGQEFVILNSGKSSSQQSEFSYTDTEQVLDNAIYRKNTALEEKYGITFTVIEDTGTANTGYNRMYAAYTSGSRDYDMAMISAYDVVPLAYNNCLYDLNSVPYLDPTAPWWDQAAYNELNIKGVLFFTTGDISVWDDMQQYCVAFNKTILKTVSPDYDIYEVMRSGKWTMDEMNSLAALVTDDLDGNGIWDMKDKYGILTWDDTVYGVLGSSGEKVVTYNRATDELELTITGNERVVDVMSKYTDICFSGNAINYQRFTSQEAIQMFQEDRTLFFLCRAQSLDAYRDKTTDYGILPFPKYQEIQDRYYTTISPFHLTFLCVLNLDDNIERTGIILEDAAYQSMNTLTPAYYEKTLKGTYIRDDESLETLEILAATRIYDIGYYTQPANINKQLIYLFREGSKNFASTFDSLKSAAEEALSQINRSYTAAAAEWNK